MDDADAQARYTEAKRLFRDGRHAEALALLQALDAALPSVKHVLLAQAECQVALSDLGAARSTCENILAHGDDARARRILARCKTTSPPLPPRDARAAISDNAPEPPAPASRKSYRGPLAAIAIVIVVASALAYAAERRKAVVDGPGIRSAVIAETPSPESAKPIDPVAEHAEMLNERKALRDAAAREAEAKLVAEKEAASKRPGYVIPESDWNLDPETGVPEWRPGIYHQLPCPGSWFEPWQGPRTLDVYIPLAYAERPEELFPTLSITMPHVNPGFLGLEPWAERRDVILIVINSSTNDFHPGGNTEAQIAAMEFLYGRLRAHPTLNLAAGTSGGARMALRAASRWPDAFAGVLLMAHSGDDLPLAPHLRIAIIHGRDDFNAEPIRKHSQRLRAAGYDLRLKVIPGGHITAPAAEQDKMLDWMLEAARRDLETAAEPEQAEN